MSVSPKDSWLSRKGSKVRRTVARMSGAAIIRRVYGAHAAKALASEHDVSPSATKKWLRDGLPAARLEHILVRALARLDRRLCELAEIEASLRAELDRLAGGKRR